MPLCARPHQAMHCYSVLFIATECYYSVYTVSILHSVDLWSWFAIFPTHHIYCCPCQSLRWLYRGVTRDLSSDLVGLTSLSFSNSWMPMRWWMCLLWTSIWSVEHTHGHHPSWIPWQQIMQSLAQCGSSGTDHNAQFPFWLCPVAINSQQKHPRKWDLPWRCWLYSGILWKLSSFDSPPTSALYEMATGHLLYHTPKMKGAETQAEKGTGSSRCDFSAGKRCCHYCNWWCCQGCGYATMIAIFWSGENEGLTAV